MTPEARTLAVQHLQLADKYVTTYLSRRPSLRHLKEDLIQEARIGLMRAAEDFDTAKGVPFEGYAWGWMQAKTRRYIEFMSGATWSPKPTAHFGLEGRSGDNTDAGDVLRASHEPSTEDDPSDAIDAPRVWAEVATRMQNAPHKKGRGAGYKIERRKGEAEDFLRHEFGGVPLRTLAAEQGVSFQRVHQQATRLRANFRRRYPEAAGWLDALPELDAE